MPTTTVKRHKRKTPSGGKTIVKKHRRHLPVRTAHQLRPVHERDVDERTTEPLGTIDRWYRDPVKYDYPRVDTGLPEGFKFKTITSKIDKDDKWLVLVNEKGKHVGEIGYMENHDDPDLGKDILYLGQLEVTEKGKGYSNLLMREMTKKADLEGKRMGLVVYPVDDKGYFGDTKKGAERLSHYYQQFGFKKVKKALGYYDEMARDPQKKRQFN